MKFAENNRISHRQMYRQIILTFAAPFLLTLFGGDKLLGIWGIAGTMAALALLVFYVIFLIRLAPYFSALDKAAGAFGARAAGVFFLIYVILTGAYLVNLLGEVVPMSLLTGVSGRWLSFLSVAACALGTHKGMQRRGRIAEVSGGLLLGSILLMMILCLGQCRLSYLQEMMTAFPGERNTFLRSGYMVLCAFSGIGLLPFMLEDVGKQGSAGKTVAYGILTVGALLVGMLLLLPAVLGWERVKTEAYPVLPLLAGADLPGNVLARFDVLWMGFLLYSLLFAIGSLFHYGHQIIRRTRLGTGRCWLAVAVYLFSILRFDGMGIRDYYGVYLAYVFVPGLLLCQIFVMAAGKGRRKKRTATAALSALVLMLGLVGCAGVEPEKRLFPLALGADVSEEGFSLVYGMPDLPQATGQEKPEEEGSEGILSIRGKDFRQIEAAYNRSQEKYLDMGHLEVLVLGDKLLNGREWATLLEYLKTEPYVGENVYVFRTADVEKILSWRESSGTSVGEYLTGLLENRTTGQQKRGVTLRELYYTWYANGSLPFIPEVQVKNDQIEVFLDQENPDGGV